MMQQQLSRRRFVLGIGLLSAASLLQACSPAPTATPPTAAPAAPAAPATTAPAAAAPTAVAKPTTAAAAPTTAPAAATVAPAAAAATPAPAAGGAPQRGGTLTIGTAQQLQVLDPHKGGLRLNRTGWMGLYSFLTRYDDKGVPSPMLAQSWDASADGLTVTWKLRQGVKFHNGREMTSDDVKFSIDRILNRDTGSPMRSNITAIQEVQAPDKYTVVTRLDQPSGTLPAALAIVSIVAKENIADIDTKPIGTGPFRLKAFNAGQSLDLETFPDYWEKDASGGALPYLDGVSVKTLSDVNALFTALTTGSVQAMWQIPEQLQVQADSAPTVQLVPSKFKTTYDEWFFQADVPPFDNVVARQAFMLALDKQAMVDAGYFGKADPRWNNNIVPPGSWAEKPGIPDIKRDPAKAKQLFEQAGVKEILFLGYTATPQFKPISQVMERNLAEAGVTAKLDFTDLNTWLTRIKVGNQKDAWGTNNDEVNGFAVNISVNPPEPGVALASWGCHTHFGSHFCDEELAKAGKDGASSSDLNVRKDAYARYQDIWQKDVPAVINGVRAFTHASLKKVHGLADDDGALNYRYAWMEK
jgi:ABC-type transport system substrate-binding protein